MSKLCCECGWGTSEQQSKEGLDAGVPQVDCDGSGNVEPMGGATKQRGFGCWRSLSGP